MLPSRESVKYSNERQLLLNAFFDSGRPWFTLLQPQRAGLYFLNNHASSCHHKSISMNVKRMGPTRIRTSPSQNNHP